MGKSIIHEHDLTHDIPPMASDIVGDAMPSVVAKDYFVEKNGLRFAGTHLLLDFWGAKNLTDQVAIEKALTESVIACRATLLHIHLHQFQENGGISGVAILAESHISIHTWPERGFAAFDIFMCGNCEPHNAVTVLKRYFMPNYVQLCEQHRGLSEDISE